jgi:hypothetical protein
MIYTYIDIVYVLGLFQFPNSIEFIGCVLMFLHNAQIHVQLNMQFSATIKFTLS